MPVNVTLLGSDFPDVPSVVLPKTGGGSANFYYDLKPILLRNDAELVSTHSYDKMIVEDEEKTIPSYSTTAQTLKATENLSETVSLSYANYNYYIAERFLTIPYYNVETKGKGRSEWQFTSALYEIIEIPANVFKALSDPTKAYTSRSYNVIASGAYSKEIYWSSTTAIGVYTSNAYGVYQTPVAPTVSSSTLTLKTPTLGVRGHTTYLSSTYFNALTDIRYQWVIDVWRVPKNSMNEDGWIGYQNAKQIIDCLYDDETLK